MTIRYKSEAFELSTTNITTVLTCPADATIIVKNLQASSHDGASGVNVDAYLRKSGTTDDVRIAKVEINDNPRFHNLVLTGLNMEASDILKVQADNADDISGFVSYALINRSQENGHFPVIYL